MIKFITDYWVQIIFILGFLIKLARDVLNLIEGTKCSLRNDILQIYDQCKEKKEISKYDLEAIEMTFITYKKLRGNSFIQDIVKEVRTYKKI